MGGGQTDWAPVIVPDEKGMEDEILFVERNNTLSREKFVLDYDEPGYIGKSISSS